MRSLQWSLGAFFALVVPVTAVGQNNPSPAAYPPDAPISAMMISSPFFSGHAVYGVKGNPFSANVDYEFTQVLAGDNHIRREQHGKIFRDGEGRIRTETEPETPPGPSVVMRTVTINDPVSQTMITWHPDGLPKSAEVDHMSSHISPRGIGPTAGSSPTSGTISPAELLEKLRVLQQAQLAALQQAKAAAPAATAQKPRRPGEDLGEKDIEGFIASGFRVSSTTPAGKIGNEKPIVKVDELWWSKDLSAVLLAIYDDPLYGRKVMRLTNIQPGEPDSQLFQIPPDYTVREFPEKPKTTVKPAQ